MTRRAFSRTVAGLVAACGVAAPAFAAEAADAVSLGRTRVVFQLDRETPVEVRSRFQADPPAVVLEFPSGQVSTTLPERSAIRSGAVLGFVAHSADDGNGARSLRAIDVLLRGDYPHRVSSDGGRIIVDIQHPQALAGASIEVSLRGGSVIRTLGSTRVTQRFQAMQEALTQAQPPAFTAPALSAAPAAAKLLRPARVTTRPALPAAGSWALALLAAALGAGAAMAWPRGRASRRSAPEPERLPSGIALIDQLVLRAFERQGFRLMSLLEPDALPGTVRLVAKDGAQAALGCVGNSAFFEKQTVERFVRVMRAAGVSQGYLAATGAFTVPAQRLAKERGVTLLGREHVVELLSLGATSEFFTKQIDEARRQLAESRGTLQHYASQLDALRRQRNEASWRLGEERAKAGKLEADLAVFTRQVQEQAAALEHAQQEAASLQRQWEENEWYLGESRARVRFLDGQLETQAEQGGKLQAAERARDEANWYLGEERRKVLEMSAKLVELQNALDGSVKRELLLQEAFDEIRRKLSALETYGERRGGARTRIPDAAIELRHGGKDDILLFSGAVRDFSDGGIGLEAEQELPDGTLRALLRLPGLDAPVESEARVVWQRAGGASARYAIGCRWLRLPDEARTRIATLMAGHAEGA